MSEQTKDDRRNIAQIGRMIRSIVEVETLDQCYWVGGKVAHYHKSNLGHIYFDLVDGYSRIRCMLPERQSGNLEFDIKNHMEIEVYGDIQVYETNVQVQIIVQKAKLIDSHGLSIVSAIHQLTQEGLYPKQPKHIPSPIRRIAIITSKSSRAIGDFEKAYRLEGHKAVLTPVTWQYVTLEGNDAQKSILNGLLKLNQNSDIDIIAIIRGGGRYENLAVFDDLDIARAIATSSKFIITGIGHEKDDTLADAVADYVASTPTAVAHYIANLIITTQSQNDDSTLTETQTSQVNPQIINGLIILVGILFLIVVVLLILNFR